MELPIAAKVLFHGMMKGIFTSKKLGDDYFAPGIENWVHARRIINGLDKANALADYGKRCGDQLHDVSSDREWLAW